MLSHKALETKLNELKKKALKNREGMARTNAGLTKELEAARERNARVEGDVWENGQSKNR